MEKKKKLGHRSQFIFLFHLTNLTEPTGKLASVKTVAGWKSKPASMTLVSKPQGATPDLWLRNQILHLSSAAEMDFFPRSRRLFPGDLGVELLPRSGRLDWPTGWVSWTGGVGLAFSSLSFPLRCSSIYSSTI